MIWVGTSGYNYPEWRGSFYPEGMPEAEMLPFYAERFSTVEINYSFYRLPSVKALEGWAAATPGGFRLTLKAPRKITHDTRLRDCEDLTRLFCDRAAALGPRLGVLLFQLPPNLRKDTALLSDFLALLPGSIRTAFEFRNRSWLDQEVFDRLAEAKAALCIMDSDKTTTPVLATADHAYLRLRDGGYSPDDIDRWAAIARELEQRCSEVFVYFKHEEAGKGAQFGRQFLQALATSIP